MEEFLKPQLSKHVIGVEGVGVSVVHRLVIEEPHRLKVSRLKTVRRSKGSVGRARVTLSGWVGNSALAEPWRYAAAAIKRHASAERWRVGGRRVVAPQCTASAKA